MGVVVPFPLRPLRTRVNYYKRFPGDYQRDTGHLSLAQHGVYALLLDHYYSTRAPLPANSDALYRICKAITAAERRAVLVVADAYFTVRDDGLRHNSRADEEIAKWQARAQINRTVGASGGRPKKNPDGNPRETQTVFGEGEVRNDFDFKIDQKSTQSTASALERRSNANSFVLQDNSHRSDNPQETQTVSETEPTENPLQNPESRSKNKNPAAPANCADSDPDQDPDSYLIWTAGLQLLGESKRSLMGKLVKEHGREMVARKLGELMAMTEKPRDPAAYFIGVMRKLERRAVC